MPEISKKERRRSLVWLVLLVGLSICSTAGALIHSYNLEQHRKLSSVEGKYSGSKSNRNIVRHLEPVFGEEDGSREVVFPILNDTDHEIKILRIERSCSCSDARLDKTTITPNEQAELRLTIHHRGRFGAQHVACMVVPEVGDPWVCEVITYVHQRFHFDPQIINFGEISASGREKRNVVLEQRAPNDESIPHIQKLFSEIDGCSVSLKTVEDDQISRGFTLRRTHLSVDVSPKTKTGRAYFGNVVAKFNGRDDESRTAILPITWQIPTVLQARPSRLLFGLVKQRGDVLEKVIQVKRTDGGNVKYVEIHLTKRNGSLTISRELARDHSRMIVRVRVDPRKLSTADLVTILNIRIQGNDTGELEIPILVSKCEN